MEEAQADASCMDEDDLTPPHSEPTISEPISSTAATAQPATTSEEDFLAPSYTFLEKVKMEFANQPNVFVSFFALSVSNAHA